MEKQWINGPKKVYTRITFRYFFCLRPFLSSKKHLLCKLHRWQQYFRKQSGSLWPNHWRDYLSHFLSWLKESRLLSNRRINRQNFQYYIKNLWKKTRRKIHSIYFLISYCPLVWMCHSKIFNDQINKFHEADEDCSIMKSTQHFIKFYENIVSFLFALETCVLSKKMRSYFSMCCQRIS